MVTAAGSVTHALDSKRFNASQKLVIAFIVMTYTEGLYLPLLYAHGMPASIVKMLLISKYVFAFAGCLVFSIRSAYSQVKPSKEDWLALFLILVLVGLLFLTSILQPIEDVSRFTLFLAPLALFLAGRSLSITEKQLLELVNILIVIFLLVSCFAVADLALSDGSFWRNTVQQEKYLIEAKGYRGDTVDGLIGNFYYDPYGLRIRRAVGTLGDPLAFAYASVLPLCLIWFTSRQRMIKPSTRLLRRFIGILGLVLSLTRAVIISFAMVALLKKLFPRKYIAIAIITALFLLFALSGSSFITASVLGLNDSSTHAHLESLADAGALITSSWPRFIVGDLLFLGKPPIQLFESGLLNLASTIGVLFVAYYSFILSIVKRLANNGSAVCSAIALCGTVGAVTSITFSESFFSFTGYGLFWLFAGMAISHQGSSKAEQTCS